MAGSGHRRATIAGGVAIVVGLALLTAVALPASGSGQSAGYTTAYDACQFPSSAEKDDGQIRFDWRLVLRDDRADASVLLMASGDDEALCMVGHQAGGRYGASALGLSRHEPGPATGLTFDTGMGPPTGSGPSVAHVFVGRVPPGAATVVVATPDGATFDAMVSDGFYLAWFDGTSGAAHISARDAAGHDLGAIDVPTSD